jgi:glycine cleavage system transcriptional repressor
MNKIKNLIISAIGSDKPGIVSMLSGIINRHGGNIEESRMTVLGSDFVVIMLISVDTNWEESLLVSLESVRELSISIKETSSKRIIKEDFFNIELNGADNEGIIDVLSNYLVEKSMNIQDMDTNISNAPVTGTPLFNLRAIVEKTKNINLMEVEKDLNLLGNKLGVEIKVLD